VTRQMPRAYVNSKLSAFGTTIFAEMSALAESTGSINLGQGFPDTDGPSVVAEAAVAAIRAGRGNQYPPGPGIIELRTAIADHQRAYYGIELDPAHEVLVTAGATEALAAAALGLLEAGDEVIVFEPFYDSYPAAVAMAGAKIVPVTLRPPSFQVDIDELRSAVTTRTRLIIVNTPHNPTGTVFGRETLEGIARVAIEGDLIVLSDEAYEHLTFDGVRHIPISTLPGMAERTITVGSAGKSLSFTGWKVGWATGPAPLVAAVRAAKQFLTYVSAGPFQYAVAEGLGLGRDYFDGFAADLASKRNRLADGLRDVGFEVYLPQGTYFITTDISGLTDHDAKTFCRELPQRCGVVAIPNSVFYARPDQGRSLVRFAFCKRHDVIDEAVSRLAALR
jgi:N-succinyldiaminopimelate aminotransferase